MITQVRPAEFSQWMQSLQTQGLGTPLVLDVREPWELQTASVRADGFDLQHIPMRSIPQRLSELPQHSPIAVLCHHGVRSMQVAHYLAQNGFEQVVNIAGGIEAWSRERDAGVPEY
jgi:rhodanese-related sulfurtransferase